MKLILATWNDIKFKWLSEGFSETNLPIVQVNKEIEDVEENGNTCRENALIKVRSVGPVKNSIIIGEDSGLFIDALDGFPGVKTVRWMAGSDDDRSIKILDKMRAIPGHKRTAQFISSIALLYPDGKEAVFNGILKGLISTELTGTNGRGYQRIFLLEQGRSLADSGSSIIKDNDHRDQAIGKAVRFILDSI